MLKEGIRGNGDDVIINTLNCIQVMKCNTHAIAFLLLFLAAVSAKGQPNYHLYCYELTLCPIATEAPTTSDKMLGGGAFGR